MKFILLSDFHGTSRNPRARKDNVLSTFVNKLEYIFKRANEIKATILQTGDLFDTPRDIEVLFKFISIRIKYPNVKFFCVYGQHDQYYRNKNVPCNLNILQKSGLIEILNDKPIILGPNIYGSGWNEKIPKLIAKEDLNILVIHKNISIKKLWYNHKIIKPKELLKKKELSGYDLILCGDIHISFIKEINNKIVCNTGPILRLEANKYNSKHQPKFYIYDTIDKTIEVEIIPHSPYKEVIYNRYIKKDKDIEKQNNTFKDIKSNLNNKQINILTIINELIKKSSNKSSIEEIMKELQDEIKEITI